MKVQLDLPGSVRVKDQTTYKGHEVTVAHVLGHPALYYVGKDSSLSNSDWEDILSGRLSDLLAELLQAEYPEDWSTKNPTGRELYDHDPVAYLSESEED